MQPYYTTIPVASGIYKITCTANNRLYIGSAINIRKRIYQHIWDLRRLAHHSITLQRAWDKYGETAFTYEVLELVLAPFLLEREQYWLDKLQPFDERGFNIAHYSQAFHTGMKATPETLEKLRISHTGYRHTEEAKRNIREALLKRPPVSPETCEKIRRAKLGHTLSPEGRAKMIASKTGHTYTPEVYASRMKTLLIVAPDGTEYLVTGVKKFCQEHNLDISSLMRVAKGTYRQHKGWIAKFPLVE